MNRITTSLLFLMLCCLSTISAYALEPVNGVYQIGSADNLLEFAQIVNAGESDAKAVLTADIDLSGKSWTPIGNNDHRYVGTFDGQFHVIDNLYCEGVEKVGIFGVVSGGCVIKNLIAGPNNVIKGDHMIGGIIGTSEGSGLVTLENVGHEGYVEGSGNNCCAFFGVVMNGGPATKMINCYNTGDIKAGGESAIITGWFGGHGSVEVKGFWNTGNILAGGDGNNSLWRNNAAITIENIFHLNAHQGATAIGNGDIASGKLAYGLNGNKDAGSWRQNLEGSSIDARPTFNPTHAKVYANGALKCDGITPKEGTDVTFSNHEGSTIDSHHYVGGFCEVCHKIQDDFCQITDGFYLINDGNQLNWYAYKVNHGEGAANGKLTADIDMANIAWTPIGQDGRDFKGHFDGQGHRICNLVTVGELDNQALFGQAVGGAIIENVIIDKSCVMQGKAFTAGILGHVWGDGVIIRNCGNEADITGTAQNAAGILGCSEKVVHISNCYNTGNINGQKENAGICAWMGSNNSTIKNCYSAGAVNDGAGLWRNNGVTGENMYQIDGEQGTAFTVPQMKSGELAYLLNGRQSTDVTWYQVIGTDNHPLPFGTAVVYANGNLKCDGITPAEGGSLSYSNTEGGNVAPHAWNDKGFCQACGTVQPDYLTPVEGFYELANEHHLNWFAHYVTAVNQQVDACLTADIDMLQIDNFPGIGDAAHPFAGTFDGKSHMIKNLAIDMPEEAAVGLFRVITAGSCITGITLDSSCSFRGKNFVGAFVGQAVGNGGAILEQLGNEAMVVSTAQNAGALVGCNTSGDMRLNVSNCYNAGAITSEREAGGLSGWFGNDAVVTNCYNMGVITNGESFARGNNIQITNCFDYVTDWPALPVSPIEDFTNGVIYQKLSEAAPGIWFLSAQTDGHPVLYNTGITTGVEAISITDGLQNDGPVYDLMGRKVSEKTLRKGVYIKNGKKFVVR